MIALAFIATSAHVLSKERIAFVDVIILVAFWLVCGWAHPIAGTVGFVPAMAAARWFNSRNWKMKVPPRAICIAYAAVFFAAIEYGYGKHFLSAAFNEVPPTN